MIREPSPEMSVIEFFDRAYARYSRYWLHSNCLSVDPEHFPPAWSLLLRALAGRPAGRALDLGAGEGWDAIRLARLGYEVDAIEGSAVGAEKMDRFSRQAGLRLNTLHADVNHVTLATDYDVVICCGVLHYIKDKPSLIEKMQKATRKGGYNLVMLFTDYTPVPACHQIVEVHCDNEKGLVYDLYSPWRTAVFLDRDKQDRSHPGFPPHSHSMIKLLSRRPGD